MLSSSKWLLKDKLLAFADDLFILADTKEEA
jgi:hypothetical protein